MRLCVQMFEILKDGIKRPVNFFTGARAAKGQPAVSLVGFANTEEYVSDVTYLDRRSSSWPSEELS